MSRTSIRSSAIFCAALAVLGLVAAKSGASAPAASAPLPNPAVDHPLAKVRGEQTAVFAGGCFWGIQAVFEHVKGVVSATSGYAGGEVASPSYEDVSTGTTGHAESVRVVYDSSQISYGQLLKVFFAVAHDPTELNRQGPDTGPQYRSAIFYANADQKKIAESYIAQLTQAKTFRKPIVTQVAPLHGFYPAEDYHQDYAVKHPHDMYIMINDAPKVDHLRTQLPDLYRDYPLP